MKKIFLFFALVLIAWVSPVFAESTFTWAQGMFTLSAPLGWNLYVGWESVSIPQELGGDLAGVAGNELRITAPVQGDVRWVASNISIDANVAGDVRIVSANVYVNQNVGGDLIIAWANVIIAPNVVIWWDLVVWGAKLDIKWTVNGNAKIRSSIVNIGWEIKGNLLTSFEEILIFSGAKVGWSINYKAPAKNVALEGLSSGAVDYTLNKWKNGLDDKQIKSRIIKLVTGFVLYKWLFMAVFALLLVFNLKKFFVWVSELLTKKPWMSFLTWLLIYISTPIIIFIIALSVLGLPIAGILACMYGALLLVSGLSSTAVLASWMIEKFMGGLEKAQRWKIVLVVLLVAFLFAVISGVDFIAIFFAMGALISHKSKIAKKMIEEIR